MSAIYSSRSIKNKHDVYRDKDSMKKFRDFFRKHTIKIINFKNKKNETRIIIWKIKSIIKVRDHCHYTGEYRGAAYSICNLKCSVSKGIRIAFHNRSNYDYHFIIKELAEEF